MDDGMDAGMLAGMEEVMRRAITGATLVIAALMSGAAGFTDKNEPFRIFGLAGVYAEDCTKEPSPDHWIVIINVSYFDDAYIANSTDGKTISDKTIISDGKLIAENLIEFTYHYTGASGPEIARYRKIGRKLHTALIAGLDGTKVTENDVIVGTNLTIPIFERCF